VALVVNTTSGLQSIIDSFSLRRTALETRTPYVTTIEGAAAAAEAMIERVRGPLEVLSIQEYQRMIGEDLGG
jgi:carbamoyl-phosphate synthase large subunit